MRGRDRQGWIERLLIEHWFASSLVGSIPLLLLGAYWSMRGHEPGPLIQVVALLAAGIAVNWYRWRPGGSARRRHELARLPPPPVS